jgi:hypothetical protein
MENHLLEPILEAVEFLARQPFGFFVTHEPAILDLLRRHKTGDQDTIVQ